MTLTIKTNPEEIKPARVETIEETGHHSYAGRSELIAQLVNLLLSEGKLKLATDYSKLSDKARKETGAAAFVMPIIKARYPNNASPAHVMETFWSRVQSLHKKSLKEESAVESKSESKKSESKPKARSVKPGKSSKSKSSKKTTEKPSETLTVAA